MIIPLLISTLLARAQDYALDDAHNHDGTHVEGQENCGGNYMFPGDIARLGSHSFIVLGEDGPEHLLLDHRSGTPPHTYQFILRVHVKPEAMSTYRKLLKSSKVGLPAVTTIYFDESGKQVDRTFFCLHDLPKIFSGGTSSKDAFDRLFPIRATWQQNADFEGAFEIKKSIVPKEPPLVINRADVEILVYRYLPSYLEQASFRKYLKEHPGVSNLSDAPLTHDESPETARTHSSYEKVQETNGETCPADYYLKGYRPPKTKHAWLILAVNGKTVTAAHLYDQAPQNYQTLLTFEVDDPKVLSGRKPLLFTPDQFYCMSDIKKTKLDLRGKVYEGSDLRDFKLGKLVGEIEGRKPQIRINRILQSLMNPQAVARDVFGLVDAQTVEPSLRVEARYFTDDNFVGRPIEGYRANRCYLTREAAKALALVQKDVAAQGHSLLAFDCYRPQRAVTDFAAWAKGPDQKMKSKQYPEEEKTKLFERGYIASKSGHSRGSTIDLTLVPLKAKGPYSDATPDCRKPLAKNQLDMGTTFDCFSENANTANATGAAKTNREILKAAMEKRGFMNYEKEWWHFTLKNEPYPNAGFDLEVQ